MTLTSKSATGIRIGPQNIAYLANVISGRKSGSTLSNDTVGRVIATLISSDPDTTPNDHDNLLSLLSPRARSVTEALLGIQGSTLTSQEIRNRLDYLSGWSFLKVSSSAEQSEQNQRLLERIPALAEPDLSFIGRCGTEELKAFCDFVENLCQDYEHDPNPHSLESDVIYEKIANTAKDTEVKHKSLNESLLEEFMVFACKVCGL